MGRAPAKSGRAKSLLKKAPAIAKASSKKRESRMGKKRKAGETGLSGSYVSRSVAIRRLQLTLKDFRRLCILKGIYPRDVSAHSAKLRKSNQGSADAATFYHAKDISALSREPLVHKFREFKTFMKRVRRLVGRKELTAARRKHERDVPTYTLHHLVKERYPSFVDALRDLDDALSLVYLFSSLPAEGRVEASKIARCEELRTRWERYVVATGALKKCFVSIKGVYFQAQIRNELVTWLVPHAFSYDAPDKKHVDYRVMLTFLEFYDILLKFVLFKLYRDDADEISRTTSSATTNALGDGAVTTSSSSSSVNETKAADDATPRGTGVFRGLGVHCSREARYAWLDFLVRSGGATLVDDPASPNVTHLVTDRDPPQEGRDEKDDPRDKEEDDLKNASSFTRERVQPQWVVDSFNNRRLLPVARYAPGADLPPHLSPFVDDKDYAPAYREELDAAAPAYAEFKRAREVAEENKSKADDAARENTDKNGDDDTKALAKIMMSKKAKRLHGRMLHGIQRKKDAVDRLKARRAKLDAAAAAARAAEPDPQGQTQSQSQSQAVVSEKAAEVEEQQPKKKKRVNKKSAGLPPPRK